MKRSAFISDIIFAFFVGFLCTLFLFRYVGIRLIPALLLSALCGVLTACAIFTLLQSKRKTLFLKRSDEARASYYEKISGQVWGDRRNYDLIVNSSMGLEQCVEVICQRVLSQYGKEGQGEGA